MGLRGCQGPQGGAKGGAKGIEAGLGRTKGIELRFRPRQGLPNGVLGCQGPEAGPGRAAEGARASGPAPPALYLPPPEPAPAAPTPPSRGRRGIEEHGAGGH